MGEIKIISTVPERLSAKGIPAMMGEMEIFSEQLDWKKQLAMLLLSKIMLIFAEDMEKGMTP